MRKLTAQQKRALTKAAQDYKKEHGKFPSSTDDLDYTKVVLPIDNMNPCEVFYQNANRFLGDLYWKEI